MAQNQKSRKNIGKKIRDSSFLVETSHSSNNHHIAFSLRDIHKDYCITKCEKNDQIAFVNQMIILGSKTWQDLQIAPRHGIGCEKIESIHAPLPAPLKNKKGLKYIAFRYAGKKPMIGYRENNIFHIIWFESKFGDVYSH